MTARKQKKPSAPRRGFFLPGKDLLGIKELPVTLITAILDQADQFKRGRSDLTLQGKTIINLFFEPSTRTRTSFELAARKLGAGVINMSPQSTSLTKGESLKDMIENLEAMHPDLIVVRHAASGVPGLVAYYTKAGVINAGDGSHEHPTQALVDLFTVRKFLGKIAGLKVLIVGDLAYSRVARSNIYGFSKMGAEVTAIGPATLIPPGLEKLGAEVSTDFRGHLPKADVVMLLRIQRERQETLNFPSLAEYTRFYGLTKELLPLLKPGALIMHPGPINRGVEIDPEIADMREGKGGVRTVILDQVENATAVRMAVLSLWGGKK
ncbi:MAG: aspartate carbamoyltransferase catalytic subunit [Deltaproteobacteria bacterium]|nr:aspartate carbamoyltransferase catalytic subunit [Deltaproteobacteria bacterium]